MNNLNLPVIPDLTSYKTFKEVASLDALNKATQNDEDGWILLAIRTVREVKESGAFADEITYILGTASVWGPV